MKRVLIAASSAGVLLACNGDAPMSDHRVRTTVYSHTDSGVCAVRATHYAIDTTFPSETVEDHKSVADCVPSCGEQRVSDGFLSIESLPAGKCLSEAPCDMGAYAPCRCDTTEGPVSGYRCVCRHGQWACSNIAQGASVCACDEPDGGEW
jgi:hypothetical protein